MTRHLPVEPETRRWHISRLPAWLRNLLVVLLIVASWPAGRLLESQVNPYVVDILTRVNIAIILAVSLNLINGITGQFSLGHAGFMAVGAYTCGILLKQWVSPADVGNAGMIALFVAVLLLGGLVAAISGLVVGIPSLRLRGDYLAIVTLGFGEIIATILNNTESIGPFQVGGAAGLHGIPVFANFFWTFSFAVICVVCIWRLVYSPKGKAFYAIREDEIAAAAMGVDTTFYKVAAFVIGAFFAGIAGGLTATFSTNLAPGSFRFMRSVEIVVMVVLGGSGSITGSILAAIVLTFLPEEMRELREWRMVFYSILLIVMMILRPEGLLGNRELWWTRRKWRQPSADTDATLQT